MSDIDINTPEGLMAALSDENLFDQGDDEHLTSVIEQDIDLEPPASVDDAEDELEADLSGDGQGGEGDAEDGGGLPSAPADSQPSPSLIELAWRDTFGTEPEMDAIIETFGAIRQMRDMTPAQREAFNAALTGQVQPAPPTPPAPTPQAAPTAPTFQPIQLPEYTDEATQQAFAQLQEQMAAQQAAFQAQIEQQEQARAAAAADAEIAAHQQAVAHAVPIAEAQFREAHPSLSDSDWARLRLQAQSNPNYPVILANHRGDHVAAVNNLLEYSLTSLPDIATRERTMAAQNAADRAITDQERKRRASSVSGGSSSTPKTQPQNREQRHAALLQEIKDGALDPQSLMS